MDFPLQLRLLLLLPRDAVERFPEDNRGFPIEHIPARFDCESSCCRVILIFSYASTIQSFLLLQFLSNSLNKSPVLVRYCQGRPIQPRHCLLLRGTFQDCRPSAFL